MRSWLPARPGTVLLAWIASSASLPLNSPENRLRVLMMDRPLHRRIHLSWLSQEVGPPLWRWVMERRKFTREFKLEAVRLIKDRGVSYVQASQDLNVHPSQLRDWVKKLSEDPQHAFPGHGQMKPEQLEIVRLKREVAKLKAERDILKKAAAYFAKEST